MIFTYNIANFDEPLKSMGHLTNMFVANRHVSVRATKKEQKAFVLLKHLVYWGITIRVVWNNFACSLE